MSYDASASIRKIKAQDRLIGLLMLYPDCAELCTDLDENILSEGFIRKVYHEIITKLRDNESIDLITFGQVLSDEEMGRLSGITALSSNSADPKKEFSDCVKTLNEEYKKSQLANAENMSDDDFRNLFKQNT